MLLEIERKFLRNEHVIIDDIPIRRIAITQFYFGKLRFRKQVEGLTSYYWNMKIGKGMSKIELETRIPKFVYEFARRYANPAGILEKIRDVYQHGKHKIELDTFSSYPYTGLQVAEIELNHEKEEILPLPNWIGKEVTGDKKYANRRMAKNAIKQKV
ncbi:hypothetical protein phiAS5_ORF0131 [Aeromonas phage phiAS5]|uniref:CYTH domain-containing protein n=1 Tax=Aeromonas phage phiAS5 TaxID=879630 RepID=E1A2M8_9CAUD|nr:hypothetical protein phiAS5_ORF0131 [Aeromonas phage phiAS5]ADM79974.1 hypothetical protein phiAS5_ORF0131 [Aeromonas phage phiAS5]